MSVKLELYRVFKEVAEVGNITAAAQALYISQSAVSQSIKQLENDLQTRLFSRNSRGVTLTAEGKMLYEYVRSAMGLLETGEEKLSQTRELQMGQLVIGASDTVTSQFLLPYLDGCIAFARQAAQAGKRCALRLWNLDGETTQGANSCNDVILRRLEETFPRPWKEGWQGTTLAPRVYLEWGERFEWPDLNADDQGQSGFCQGLRDHVGVLWDGTVVPCCLDHEGDIPLGNLYDGSLEDILSSPRARAIYNGFSQSRAAEELCRRCGYRRRFSK